MRAGGQRLEPYWVLYSRLLSHLGELIKLNGYQLHHSLTLCTHHIYLCMIFLQGGARKNTDSHFAEQLKQNYNAVKLYTQPFVV